MAIAGYGLEGESNYRYWMKLGADITIFDEKPVPSRPLPAGVATVLGPDSFAKLQGFDLVVRTASLRPDKLKTNTTVWSATNEFFTKCPAPIIGVTGTKGKGTTCSLVTEILKAAGKTAHLVGNIGVAALEVLPQIKPDDIVVFELSSFQLWDLQISPHIALVLMIEPDHMDIHASMDEYVAAKSAIAVHQDVDDVVIYHPANALAAQIAERSPGTKIPYGDRAGAHLKAEAIVIDKTVICQKADVGLVGDHNLENICAAITAAWQYTQDVAAIRRAVIQFKGLPHRLEFVRTLDGVGYVNDSYSSAPTATIAAIRSFERPEILICGGFNRGLEYSDLVQAIIEQKNIKKVLLIGQTKETIAAALSEAGFEQYEVVDSLELSVIVARARQLAAKGDIVLLSPGCASFDMFKNFQQRGEQFKKIVKDLA